MGKRNKIEKKQESVAGYACVVIPCPESFPELFQDGLIFVLIVVHYYKSRKGGVHGDSTVEKRKYL